VKFNLGPKGYLIQTDDYFAAVLLLFNNEEQQDIQNIVESTQLDATSLHPILKVLIKGDILKSSDALDESTPIKNDVKFNLNLNFKNLIV